MLNYFAREESKGKQEAIKIKEIPHLTSPHRISQLNFSHNDIRAIPSHISLVRNLQIIDLSHNKITKIDHIWHLSSIKFINLSYNLISEVPNEMMHLVQIQNLDLGFNKIAILNNIKVLKRLVEMRILQKGGFIEINLEGNQILKKKGCREIYKKWMNPSLEEYQRQSRKDYSDGYIHLTKKRNSRSLEMPLKDTSMIATQRSHLLSQKIDESKSHQNKRMRPECKNQSALKASVQITEKLSPNLASSEKKSIIKENTLIVKSEMLNGAHSFEDLSRVFESTSIQDISHLGEWFCLCIDELNDLAQKFSLITENDDAQSLQLQIKSRLREESTQAKQIILMCLQLVKQAVDNRLKKQVEERLLKEILNVDTKIKIDHDIILKEIGNSTEALPIKLYKIWVALYRKLKSIVYQLPEKIALHRVSYARELQIQQLLSISPDKKSKLILPSHQKRESTNKNQSNQKGSATKGKLDQLLFSRNRSECLLLSDQKHVRASSQKKSPNKGQCESCLMFKWVSSKAKEEVAELNEKVQYLAKEREEHISIIHNLQKFKQKYLNLQSKQQLIIGELQYLNPSTYQNFLLEQAKTIQYMLQTSDMVDYKKMTLVQGEKQQPLHTYTSKQIDKDREVLMNTRLSSNNIKTLSNHNKVSEFSIDAKKDFISKESTNNIRSSYFKNKNIVTTINRTHEDPKTHIFQQSLPTEENRPKNEQMNRPEVVVSQFNSHVNSLQNTSSKEKNITFQQFSTKKNEGKKEQDSNTRMANVKNSQSQNDVILISEGSELKNVSLEKLESKAGRNENKSKMLSYLKSEQFNQIMRAKLVDPNLKSKKSNNQKLNSQVHKTRQTGDRKSSQKHPRMNSQLSNKENICPENLKRNKTAQRFYQDGQYQAAFVPMESTEAESYKRYIKYHLRNNIIQILFKKGNCVTEQIYQDRLTHSKQKLINKKNTSQRSNLEEPLSKRSQINKTFR